MIDKSLQFLSKTLETYLQITYIASCWQKKWHRPDEKTSWPKLSNSNWCDVFWWHFLIWWLGAGLDTFCGWLVGLSGMSSTSDVCWITSLDTRSDFAYLPVVIVLVSKSGKPTLSLSSLPAFLQPLISVRYVLLWNQLLVSFCFKFIWHWTHFCKVSFAGLLSYQSLSKGSCSIKETV